MTRSRLADRLARLEQRREAALADQVERAPLECLGGRTLLGATPAEVEILIKWLEADLADHFEGPDDREQMLAELASKRINALD